MRTTTERRLLQMWLVNTVLLAVCATTAAQITTAPPPNPNITPAGPQRHQPPGGRPVNPSSQIATVPPPASVQLVGQGVIGGYVYWDTKSVAHNPVGNCNGLVAAVSVGTPAKGSPGFQQFKRLGSFNNFTSMGTVGSWTVCAYSVPQVPTGQDLQVMVYFKQPTFTPPVIASVPPSANNPNQPIKIPGGTCNKVPPSVPSASVLGSGWWTCGNNAYNVNFVLQPTTAANMTSGGLQITVVSGAPQGTALLPQNSGNPGMLGNNNKSRGMLLQSPPSATQTHSPGKPLPANPAGGGSAQLSPQPYSPAGTSGSRTPHTGALPVRQHIALALSAPKQGQKITNPKAALQNAGIIAVLQKQSQAASAEASQMKLSLRPAGIQVNSGPSQTMAATTVAGRMTNASNGAVSAKTLGGSGAIGSALPPHFQNLAITCSNDPSMRVLTVSGGPAPVIFTPDPKYNFYTFTGCSFGNPGANSKVYIYYQGTFHEDFQIQEWTDNWIKLSLDPNISGVDDQNNVVLVVQRDDGKQWTKPGYRFYAARATVQLAPIPQTDFSLNRFRPDNTVTQNWRPTYTSASSAAVTPNLPGVSAEVHWDITTDPDGTIVGGTDIYDISHLHSTFVLDSAWMEWRDVSCTDPNFNLFAASKNNWSIDWYGPSGVQVGWQGQMCKNTPGSCGGAFQGDCFSNVPESNYGVSISVTGPRGIDPWSGKPTS